MTTAREQLKSMLNDLINDRQDSAEATIHDYITTKTRELAGFAPVEAPQYELEEGLYTDATAPGWYAVDSKGNIVKGPVQDKADLSDQESNPDVSIMQKMAATAQ